MSWFHSYKTRLQKYNPSPLFLLIAAFCVTVFSGIVALQQTKIGLRPDTPTGKNPAPKTKGVKSAGSKLREVLGAKTGHKDSASSNTLSQPVFADDPGMVTEISAPKSFAHKSIVTTIFWVGEGASGENGHISNVESTWDEDWAIHFGGTDSPNNRKGFLPAGFAPKENPFYFALPYSDIDSSGNRKPSAVKCPLYTVRKDSPHSWCKNSWIAIKSGEKIAYAQWEDAGPFGEDDVAYVFGTAAPANKVDTKAGLDVSPAVKDFLGLDDVSHCDWTFVSSSEVPSGPWKQIITTTPGTTVN